MESYLIGLGTIAALAALSLVWQWNFGGQRPIRFVFRVLTRRRHKSN
ncbi:MAG: hypothetical protein R2752_22570 [Vicinamibacterales bacterium]